MGLGTEGAYRSVRVAPRHIGANVTRMHVSDQCAVEVPGDLGCEEKAG